MTLSPDRYAQWLAADQAASFPWERIPEHERRARRLAAPATNLGSGRGRFWELMRRLSDDVERGAAICDVGAYPGTALRLIRQLPRGAEVPLTAAGFGFSAEFRSALEAMDVPLIEAEFDVRRPPDGPESHLLSRSVDEAARFEVAVCTEVIEHQVYPVALLVGINRHLREDGRLYLTTNSASFIGDVLKLAVGSHNVENVESSHVLADYDWRPHIRLYGLDEVKLLLTLSGFQVVDGYYFDNGNVYAGGKGVAMAALRRVAGTVPHLRSHIWIEARKTGAPDQRGLAALEASLRTYGLEDLMGS